MAKYTPQSWSNGSGGGTPISAARLSVLENGVREASMGRSTTFPTSPVDGDIHVYPADTTNGVMWMFMYRSAPNDWEFIGGAPLYNEVTAGESTSSASYAALATAGPSIALPFVGDWMVEIGARAYGSAENMNAYMSYDIGGTGAVDADAIVYHVGDSFGSSFTAAPHQVRKRRKTGLTAVTLTAKYKQSSGGSSFFDYRWMAVTPVRHTP